MEQAALPCRERTVIVFHVIVWHLLHIYHPETQARLVAFSMRQSVRTVIVEVYETKGVL
mgnify:CR=1 FL=1